MSGLMRDQRTVGAMEVLRGNFASNSVVCNAPVFRYPIPPLHNHITP